MPQLRRDWAHPGHICAGTGLSPATSAPGRGVRCVQAKVARRLEYWNNKRLKFHDWHYWR